MSTDAVRLKLCRARTKSMRRIASRAERSARDWVGPHNDPSGIGRSGRTRSSGQPPGDVWIVGEPCASIRIVNRHSATTPRNAFQTAPCESNDPARPANHSRGSWRADEAAPVPQFSRLSAGRQPGRFGVQFPAYAFATTVAQKTNPGMNLISIESVNRIVQAPLAILFVLLGRGSSIRGGHFSSSNVQRTIHWVLAGDLNRLIRYCPSRSSCRCRSHLGTMISGLGSSVATDSMTGPGSRAL